VMSKEPAARYRTADQLGHVLENYRDRGREQTMNNAPSFRPVQPAPPPAQQGYPPPQQGYQQLPFSQPGQVPPQQPPPLPFTQGQQPAQPTQRYDVAPNAPGANPYNRPQAPSPFDQGGAQQYQQPGTAPQPWSGGVSQSSQPFQSRPLDRYEDTPPALDVVTVALAVLAFFAVLCLIPLWIQVYIARFSGGG
jgi:hypothetical protein